MAKRGDRNADTPPVEWAIGAIGALIFVAMLAVLVGAAIGGTGAPPEIVARVRSVTPLAEGYLVEFTVDNDGERTAADLLIAAELANGETARARFDYLPPHSQRSGGVYFRSDPRAGGVRLRAEGYADP